MPPHAGRRAYDNEVDPAVQVFVNEEVGTTRHQLRDEFTVAMLSLSNKLDALNVTVTEGHAQASLEHAQVRGDLERVCERIDDAANDIGELQGLFKRVRDLEKNDELDDAREETREKILTKLEANRRWTVGTIIAAAGLLSGVYALIPH